MLDEAKPGDVVTLVTGDSLGIDQNLQDAAARGVKIETPQTRSAVQLDHSKSLLDGSPWNQALLGNDWRTNDASATMLFQDKAFAPGSAEGQPAAGPGNAVQINHSKQLIHLTRGENGYTVDGGAGPAGDTNSIFRDQAFVPGSAVGHQESQPDQWYTTSPPSPASIANTKSYFSAPLQPRNEDPQPYLVNQADAQALRDWAKQNPG